MPEYTYDDINITGSERVLNAIGKECYGGDSVVEVLDNAANDRCKFTLKRVNMNQHRPFGDPYDYWYPFMIIKKGPEFKRVPFRDAEAFLNAYKGNESFNLNKSYHYLLTRGIWLKLNSQESNSYCMVTEIRDLGVVIGDNNTKIRKKSVINETTTWEELLRDYTFLDGTPCGWVEVAHE